MTLAEKPDLPSISPEAHTLPEATVSVHRLAAAAFASWRKASEAGATSHDAPLFSSARMDGSYFSYTISPSDKIILTMPEAQQRITRAVRGREVGKVVLGQRIIFNPAYCDRDQPPIVLLPSLMPDQTPTPGGAAIYAAITPDGLDRLTIISNPPVSQLLFDPRPYIAIPTQVSPVM